MVTADARSSMPDPSPSALLPGLSRWAAPFLAATGVIAFQLLLLAVGGSFGHRVQVLLLLVPIGVAAFRGGWAAGIVATITALLLADFFQVMPLRSIDPFASMRDPAWITLGIVGVTTTLVGGMLRRVRRAGTDPSRGELGNVALHTALLYGLVALAWVLFTGELVFGIGLPPAETNRLTLAAGCVFVAATALGLYFTLSRQLQLWEQEATARRRAEGELAASLKRVLDLNSAIEADIVERQRAEAELRASQEHLELAAQVAEVGTFEHDLATGKAYISPVFRSLSGARMEASDPLAVLRERVIPEDRAAFLAALERARAADGDGRFEHECRILHPDGRICWLRILSRTWFAGTKPELPAPRTVGAVMDVTAQKQAEQDLRDSERRFRALIEHSADSVALLNGQFRILYLSPAGMNVEGYTPEEVVGLDATEHAHPEDIPYLRETLRQILAYPGEPVPLLWRRRHKDGRWLWLEGVATNFLLDPAVRGIVMNYRDVTQRKEAEDELVQATSLLRAVVDGTADALSVKDLEGRYLLLNQAAARLVNRSVQEALGHDDTQFLDPNVAQAIHDRDRRVMESGQADVTEESWTVNGTARAYLTTKSPLRDLQGRTIGVIGFAIDITDRRRVEAQQRQMETQLRQAQKLEAIGQLAAGIAHEINTPTQFIGDNLHFLHASFGGLRRAMEQFSRLLEAARMGTVPPATFAEVDAAVEAADLPYLMLEIPRALNESLQGVERVAGIVEAMKEFSHPGTDELMPIDLNHAISCTITVARNEWKYVADVVTDFDPNLPPVAVLPGPFNQVVLNLLVNAGQAIATTLGSSPDAKGTITVTTRREASVVVISVADTGPGIPEAIRHRIFDPFFTTKPVGKGTGQGLAIARSVVVDKHGGTIDFHSEPGRGTTFTIRLPIDAPNAHTPPATA